MNTLLVVEQSILETAGGGGGGGTYTVVYIRHLTKTKTSGKPQTYTTAKIVYNGRTPTQQNEQYGKGRSLEIETKKNRNIGSRYTEAIA